MHGKLEQIGKIRFIGLGGSNFTPFNTPFELSEEEIERVLKGMFYSAKSTEDHGPIVLLLMHLLMEPGMSFPWGM
jgi:Icc-related predicted phosphoesterase